MTDKTKFIIYALIFALTLLWGLLVYAASTKKIGVEKANPIYVPRIMECSNYNSDCGRYFKRILALYDYRVCREEKNDQCEVWYTPEELHDVFNSLNGWED